LGRAAVGEDAVEGQPLGVAGDEGVGVEDKLLHGLVLLGW
jgi:hypothetical protein